jgi:hypothetical protein
LLSLLHKLEHDGFHILRRHNGGGTSREPFAPFLDRFGTRQRAELVTRRESS